MTSWEKEFNVTTQQLADEINNIKREMRLADISQPVLRDYDIVTE